MPRKLSESIEPGGIPNRSPATPAGQWSADPALAGNEETEGGRPAFLFVCGDMAGITLDASGANLPSPAGGGHWTLARTVVLGVRDVGLPDINPEPVIRGVLVDGYYVWRMTDPTPMSATTQ